MSAGCACTCCERRRRSDTARAQFIELVELLLKDESYLFEATGNGMHVWVAYRRARQANLAPPSWVLNYFDECYQRLSAKGGTASPEVIAKHLILHTPKGGPTARDRALTQSNDLAVYQRVRLRQKLQTSKTRRKIADLIFQEVAEGARQGGVQVEAKTVRNKYYQLKPSSAKKTNRASPKR